MVKRKREDSGTELKVASRCHPNMVSMSGLAPQTVTPSALTAMETELRTVMDDFVTVYERLDQEDDAKVKPNYSYTEMIYLAILRSPNFCLPITEIYKYIKSRFSFFRNSTRKHWCNAVRHSLSKTKCFTKIAVGRGSSGNNNLNRSTYLWCIVPGSIVNFARGDYRPNVDTESGTNTLRWGYFRVNAGQFWEQVATYLQKKMEIFEQIILTTSSPGKVLEAQACYIPGSSAPPTQKSSASPELHTVFPYSAKPVQPTHTVHHGPNQSLSDSGISDSIIKSPNIAGNWSKDSGNNSLSDFNPAEKRAKCTESNTSSGYGLNSSYLSASSSVLNDTRKTPDLPDLGHVSPLSISPSLSPVGHISYENDSLLGPSFTPMFPTIGSFASTPVATTLTQPRFPQPPYHYSHSLSPPLFPSFSPPSYSPLPTNNSSTGNGPVSLSAHVPFHQPCAPASSYVPISLPYLAPAINSSFQSNMYTSMSIGSAQPPLFKPTTGTYDSVPFPPPFMTQLPYQYDQYQTHTAAGESIFNSMPFYYNSGTDTVPTPSGDWHNV